MTAYYNEIDPFAAAWLRELIKAGHIAPGVVDERSIEDVTPDDLRDFTQCHFFAGIGVWSYALRRAGWPDDRPVWTGSCPCQPFSAAGKGAGFADERHLWPSWDWLIEQRRPAVIIGEQVASKDAEPWLDLVQSDLEGMDYAFGAVAFPSAGIGAPHIRDRTYWVAHADDERQRPAGNGSRIGNASGLGKTERLADALGERGRGGQLGREDATHARLAGEAGRLADADGRHAGAERQQRGGEQRQIAQDGGTGRLGYPERLSARRDAGAGAGAEGRHGGRHVGDDARSPSADGDPGPVNGLWRDADWLLCRDGKWRPVEPGTFPLAHGAAARVGRLRGYGNAINAQAAEAFIRSYLEATA